VSTGDGALDVLALQFPGRKPLAAAEVLKSRTLRGVRFDSAA
jgi:methionyl-tRNA formyltransferase